MPKKAKSIDCPACGHRQEGTEIPRRCASCGAPVRELLLQRALEERYQERFSFLWFLVALGVTAILTAAVIVGLPIVVRALDFEGSAGMMIAIPVWFTSGLLVGLISPGRTFAEPLLAATLVAIPTVAFLIKSETVKTMPLFVYVLLSVLGVFFALLGAYAGERIQTGPPPKALD